MTRRAVSELVPFQYRSDFAPVATAQTAADAAVSELKTLLCEARANAAAEARRSERLERVSDKLQSAARDLATLADRLDAAARHGARIGDLKDLIAAAAAKIADGQADLFEPARPAGETVEDDE